MQCSERPYQRFCHYVWIKSEYPGTIPYVVVDWLTENFGEPYYRDDYRMTDPLAVEKMLNKRWSLLRPLFRDSNISSLRVHFADAKDVLLFKLRWG